MVYCAQGCFRRNVTVVTIYASLGEDALCHSLNETEVTTVICGNKELKKLVDISGQLDTVKRLICMDDEIPSSASVEQSGRWTIISLSNVEKLGQENPIEADLPLSADIAVIMYTSGSTGLPKGVMMTHANVLAVVSSVRTIVPHLESKDVYLAYLPLAHILELAAENIVAGVGSAIGYGTPLTLTDTSNKIKRGTKGDASVLRPTVMASVPAILDRVRDGVRKKVDAKGGLSKKLFDLAYARRLSALNGSWFGAWGLEMLLWNFLVFRKVRAVLGGRIRFLLSGGAPLSGDTQRFINICLGAPIGQGYGLTETCAGGTFSEFDDSSVGRVGNPVPSSFIKLVDWPEGGYLTSDSPMPRGEIVIGGPNVDQRGMRWFYTGDIGQFHADGCLEIVDRKNIVKLQHGECVFGKVTVWPLWCLHNLLWKNGPRNRELPFLILQTCVRKRTIKEVQASFLKEAKKAHLEKFEIPAKIKLLSNPWTPETGLVTAALKIKREAIRKAFSEELSKFYES
ncbi:hypothetical protein GH714_023624 [Hevea brasiliensis]|uniref:AMP-dependent synthetase/ligase domain-containing protein n=1 Tax=Hevea brasiliensis TaxID=3981 RepID=A0A6A6KTL1_HEVBR|nr:hypothetical protein GH714_023624 [Hevea brasiliensis]